jgi:hypothetical protein
MLTSPGGVLAFDASLTIERVDIPFLSWDSRRVPKGLGTHVGIVSDDGALRRTFEI